MENFNCNISTKIFFGKGKIEELSSELKKYGNNILLVYGKKSIKKNGIYDRVITILSKLDKKVFELSGIESNPRIESVYKGASICKENKIDFILAIGGGSVIDCSKSIAAQAVIEKDIWEEYFIKRKTFELKNPLPIGTILTLSATGSEMNGNTIISNLKEGKKIGVANDLLRPKFSILDPEYTFSVSKFQTAAGVVDILSHLFEQYFSSDKKSFFQDRLLEGAMKAVIKYGESCYNNPTDYEARANLMWISSVALSGIFTYGKESTDWSSHLIEHELSAHYDLTHGVGLAIITPKWMEYILSEETLDKFIEYGINVWEIKLEDRWEVAKKSIEKTKEYFKKLEMPTTLRDVNIDSEKFIEMSKELTKVKDIGSLKKLNKSDILKIYENSL